jgi:hypothetical protein
LQQKYRRFRSVRRKESHVFALLNVNQNHLLLFIGSPIFTASVPLDKSILKHPTS